MLSRQSRTLCFFLIPCLVGNALLATGAQAFCNQGATRFLGDFTSQALAAPAESGLEVHAHAVVAKHLKILIVDDEEDGRLLMRMKLEVLGHEVSEAENGEKALNFIGKNLIDLVITDQVMPLMTGLEFLEAIRQRQDNTPVIICSGMMFTELKEAAKQLGVHVVLKPYKSSTLQVAMQKVIAESKLRPYLMDAIDIAEKVRAALASERPYAFVIGCLSYPLVLGAHELVMKILKDMRGAYLFSNPTVTAVKEVSHSEESAA